MRGLMGLAVGYPRAVRAPRQKHLSKKRLPIFPFTHTPTNSPRQPHPDPHSIVRFAFSSLGLKAMDRWTDVSRIIVQMMEKESLVSIRSGFRTGLLWTGLLTDNWCVTQDLTNKWHEVKQLVPDRDMVLRNELMRQQNNERLRRAFAQKANVVGQWIERHLDAVATASMQKGKLEDNLSRLYALDKEVAAFRPNIDELERYNQDIHEAMIFDNRHTPYTMEVGCE